MSPAKVVFVMSTNYAGSTVLGLVLGSHPAAAFLGEPALALRKTSDGAWRHKSFCSICKGTDAACPIWHDATIARIRQEPEDTYRAMEAMFPGKRVLVDASKDMAWLEAGLRRVERPFVVHISKSVESFVASAMNREEGDAWMVEFSGISWARHNRKIRLFAIQNQLPYLHVTYADFATRFEATLSALDSFLGLQVADEQREFWAQPHHYVKGNPGVATHFDAAKVQGETGINQAIYTENHQRIFLDEKWRKVLSPAQVDRLYALREVAAENAVLGYHHPLRDGRLPIGRQVFGRVVLPALAMARWGAARALRERLDGPGR